MGQFYQLKDPIARKEIAEQFGITLANLSQILNFKRNGSNAEKIREMAKRKGAVLMSPDLEQKAETIKILDSKGKTERIVNLKK